MKASLFLLVIVLFITSSFTTLSPSSFRIHRQGKGITVNWTPGAGESILFFTIQKTYEDATDPYSVWEDVTTVPVAGSRSYKYTDLNIIPGSVNYRVVTMHTDGTMFISEVASIKIVDRH